jgi:transposase-like protein
MENVSTPLRTDRPQMSADVLADDKSQGHGAKSAAARERAIEALLSGKTISDAATRCGVNARTLRRWMTDDEAFKQDLGTARRAMFQAGMNRVQALTVEAVDTLAALMGKSAPPSVRLGAARTVTELAIHAFEAEAIGERLDALERTQHEQAEARARR